MNEKILLVDDDETLASLLVNLMMMNGYQAKHSFMGGQALEMILEEPPDLIILNIMMPDLNGLDVLTKLRSREIGRASCRERV